MAKRTTQEIRAQREAFLVARAARNIQSTTPSVEKTVEQRDAQSAINGRQVIRTVPSQNLEPSPK